MGNPTIPEAPASHGLAHRFLAAMRRLEHHPLFVGVCMAVLFANTVTMPYRRTLVGRFPGTGM